MTQPAPPSPDGQPLPHEPLTTKEGWRRFVDTPDEPPPILPAKQRQSLSDWQRNQDDETRLSYHSRLAIVATPAVQQISLSGRRLIVLNRHQISARRGLIVTGEAGTGKTTAITQLGKSHELAQRLRNPNPGPRLAVVYVTVPPAATPRMLAVEFARFLGLPITPRANITDITDAVCGVLSDCGCDLVIVDEIHNLNLATKAGAEASDQLKYFSERLPATFVYAGIDVERAGLFAGTRGRQIAGRFATIHTQPFGYGTSTQRQAWHALIATFENSLRLHRHKHGTLLALADYLHQRTGGMIGSLSHLLRAAAVDGLITGTEKIARTNLETIHLDRAAEHHRSTTITGKHPGRKQTGAA